MKIRKIPDRATMIRLAQNFIDNDATVSGVTIILPSKAADRADREEEVYIPRRSAEKPAS